MGEGVVWVCRLSSGTCIASLIINKIIFKGKLYIENHSDEKQKKMNF